MDPTKRPTLSWLKDGQRQSSRHRINIEGISNPDLSLAESTLVVSNVQKDDNGVYQCVMKVKREMMGQQMFWEEAQSSAELRLGGVF